MIPDARGKDRDWKNEELSIATWKDQVQDHVRNLKVHRPMERDGMHMQVLNELTDEVAKPLFNIMRSHGSLVKFPMIRKGE